MSSQATELYRQEPPSKRRPVLVPVEFSPCSVAALLFADHLATCARAPLLVLHVVHERGNRPGFYRRGRPGAATWLRPMEHLAREMLADFLAEVGQHDSVGDALAGARTRVVSGLPAQRIREVALGADAALIVMGTHERTAWSRLAAGSVAAQVARSSPVPVTLVKAVAAQGGQSAENLIGSREWWARRASQRTPDGVPEPRFPFG